MRLRCYGCGKSVSTEVPDETVVRAVLWCPECIETADVLLTEYRAREQGHAREGVPLAPDGEEPR